MMKKHRTLLLLVVVISIYAAIVVRFFLFNGGDSKSLVEVNSDRIFSPINYTIDNSFTIDNDYRDPFLGNVPKKKIVKPHSRPAKVKTEEAFPAIKYLGIIADASSSRKILSLSIHGKEFIVQEGHQIEDVKILSGDEKQVNIQFEGRQKTIKISDL